MKTTLRYGTDVAIDTENIHFALFCANIWNFLPGVPPAEYPRLYRQVVEHQQDAVRDYLDDAPATLANVAGWQGEALDRLKHEPGIICTFHTGSYRLINKLLVKEGIPYTLLVSDRVFKHEGEAWHAAYREMAGSQKQDGFDLLNAENPHVMRLVLARLGKGRSLLVYLDGNTGSGHRHPGHYLSIPFLHGCIASRLGVATLSYLAAKPIYPVLAMRMPGGDRGYAHHPPIRAGRGETRRAFANQASRTLYRILETYLRQRAEDWECWRYIHQWVVQPDGRPDRASEALRRYGEASRWHGFWHAGRHYVLDRETYQSHLKPANGILVRGQ